jgi:hypothetical protein
VALTCIFGGAAGNRTRLIKALDQGKCRVSLRESTRNDVARPAGIAKGVDGINSTGIGTAQGSDIEPCEAIERLEPFWLTSARLRASPRHPPGMAARSELANGWGRTLNDIDTELGQLVTG